MTDSTHDILDHFGSSAVRMRMIRPAKLPKRTEVVGQLAKNLILLDRNLTLVDARVSVTHGVPIDLVARDESGGIHVLDVFDGRAPDWIAHILHHMQWMEVNRSRFSKDARRVYATAVLTTLTPTAMNALELLKNLNLDCYTVHCFDDGGELLLALKRRNISVKPVKRALSEPTGVADQRIEPQTKPRTQENLKPVELTEDEIADFLEEEDKKTRRKGAKRRQGSSVGQPFI